jgi:DNA invertase Pin-like site-specific DNA recombinase
MKATDTKKRAVYYTRVSHDNQVEDGSSLDNQDDRIKAFCHLNNYEIVNSFSDPGVSGRKFENRPDFMRMIKMVDKHETDVVIVYSLSRFGRNVRDTLKWISYLESRGVSFFTLDFQIDTTTSHGKLMLQMMAAFAEFESNQRGELIQSVMKYLKKEQKVYCGPTPMGFDKVEGNLVINENEMNTVRQIFEWHAEMSYSAIATKCNNFNFQTKKGKKFHHTTIEKIVNNNIYKSHVNT